MKKSIISVEALCKSYKTDAKEIEILHSLSFDVKEGESMAITGPSGSGKTTLLGLLAGLDNSTSGNLLIDGQNLTNLNEDERSALRLQKMGFVFQNFQLLANLTAIENVMVPLELQGTKNPLKEAESLIELVGLSNRKKNYPTQLSGGEQQRIAIARAFANNPKILMADEPTGNLDGETSDKVEQLLFDLNREKGTTLIIVTHDLDLAAKTDRVLKLKNGHIEA